MYQLPLKRTLSSANLSAAKQIYSYKENQYNAQYDNKNPCLSKDVTKCSMILPAQFERLALYSCVDQKMLESLEHQKRINWCDSSRYILPMSTMDDGNCLFHAVSMYMFGVQDRDLSFRKLVYQWLFMEKGNDMLHARWKFDQNKLFEKCHMFTGSPRHLLESSWLDIIDHCSERRYECLGEIRYQSPDAFHAFIMANILCRPIIIFCCDNNQGAADNLKVTDLQGIYLPLLKHPDQCEKSPIVIGYQNGHFAPLLSSENIELPVCRTVPSVDAVHAIPLMCYDLTMLPVKFCMSAEEGRDHELLDKYLELCDVPFRERQILSALLKFKPPPAWSIELLWSFHKLVEQEPPLPTALKPCARSVVTQCKNAAANNKENLCNECYEQFLDKKRKIPKRTTLRKKSPEDLYGFEKSKNSIEGYVGNCGTEGCRGIGLPDFCLSCSSKIQIRSDDPPRSLPHFNPPDNFTSAYENDEAIQFTIRNQKRGDVSYQPSFDSFAGASPRYMNSNEKILCCVPGCDYPHTNDGYCDRHYENVKKPKGKCAMPECTYSADYENDFNLCVMCFRSQGNIFKDFEREKPSHEVHRSENIARGPFDFSSMASTLPPLPRPSFNSQSIPPMPEVFEPPKVYTGFDNRSGHHFGGQYGVMNWQKERVNGVATGKQPCHYCDEFANPNKNGKCDKCMETQVKLRDPSTSPKKCINDGCRSLGIEKHNYLCEKCYEKHLQDELAAPKEHHQPQQQQQNFQKTKMVNYEPCKTHGCIRMAVPPSLFCDFCKEQDNGRRMNEHMSLPPPPGRDDIHGKTRQICKALDCDFYGSEEYGGYCSTCFLEITKQDVIAKKNSSYRTFAPSHNSRIVVQSEVIHSLPVVQDIVPPTPCRNKTCDLFGRLEWNGFCSRCYKTHHVERDA